MHSLKLTIAEYVTVGVTTVMMALPIMNIVIREQPLSQTLKAVMDITSQLLICVIGQKKVVLGIT